MHLGKSVRLERIFNRNTGKTIIVPLDHGVSVGPIFGLVDLRNTVDKVADGGANAVLMHKGIPRRSHRGHGRDIGLIIHLSGSTDLSPFPNAKTLVGEVEDAIRLGADALAVSAFICGATEGKRLLTIANCVRQAARYDLPVVAHIYPREFTDGVARVSHKPELVAWAVRCGVECGVDVVKTAYCGDVREFGQIVSDSPVTIVTAGGPKTESMGDALQMASEVIQSGARGMTVGRNIWSHPEITKAVRAFLAVIHDGLPPEEAIKELD